jgi:hypothetical protein
LLATLVALRFKTPIRDAASSLGFLAPFPGELVTFCFSVKCEIGSKNKGFIQFTSPQSKRQPIVERLEERTA